MHAAVGALGAALPAVAAGAMPGGGDRPVLTGLVERWYVAAGATSAEAVGDALDVSVRAVERPGSPPTFQGFKVKPSSGVQGKAQFRGSR